MSKRYSDADFPTSIKKSRVGRAVSSPFHRGTPHPKSDTLNNASFSATKRVDGLRTLSCFRNTVLRGGKLTHVMKNVSKKRDIVSETWRAALSVTYTSVCWLPTQLSGFLLDGRSIDSLQLLQR